MPPPDRPARDAALLGMLAGELEAARMPFYSSAATDGRPDGWYWTPPGDERLTFLGRNVQFAERRLLDLLRADG